MQRQIKASSKSAHQVQALNPLKDMTKVESIDYLADVKNMLTETEKLELLYKTGQMDFN